MKVKIGKPLDVLSLKKNMVDHFDSNIERIRKERTTLFESTNLEEVIRCPVCEAHTRDSKLVFKVYGALYHKCSKCGHRFVLRRPCRRDLNRFYSENVNYASTYTDGLSLEVRVKDVAIPKAKWMIEQFEELYDRKPKSVLDIGAGMGHFVFACKNQGLEAYGVEPSERCRAYCPKKFGIELEEKDWEAFGEVDIITFWGVLEHLPYPMEYLRKANRLLRNRKTMVIAEVPRWWSVSSLVQWRHPDSIIRHLDPLGHIQFFTDESLVLAFEESKFTPVTKWYFGMDAYEVLMQLRIMLPKKCILSLQKAIDLAKQCDTIVVGAKPWPYISDQ